MTHYEVVVYCRCPGSATVTLQAESDHEAAKAVMSTTVRCPRCDERYALCGNALVSSIGYVTPAA